MKIHDITSDEIPAAVTFEFHGHNLSASTIFRKPEVLDMTTGKTYASIEAAIDDIVLEAAERAARRIVGNAWDKTRESREYVAGSIIMDEVRKVTP